MIELFQIPPSFGVPSASPFCLRVEAYMRLAGVEFKNHTDADPRKSPKGKVPWIVDDGEAIGDSSFILEHLATRHGADLDAALTPEQRAISHAVSRMLCENFYWVGVHSRWAYEPNWAQFKAGFVKLLPPVIGPLVLPLIRGNVKKQLHGHGLGRHTDDEIARIGRRDLDALEVLLGDRETFFGGAPTSIDATAYAFLACMLIPPFDTPTRRHLQGKPTLVAFVRRMQERLFPDYPVELHGAAA
ncbi:MAG: glutathione S-transferase family protein [Nannocystaceae bacterium]|nr:glutathione S-transferase family protein [Myxococcales bacterium]